MLERNPYPETPSHILILVIPVQTQQTYDGLTNQIIQHDIQRLQNVLTIPTDVSLARINTSTVNIYSINYGM